MFTCLINIVYNILYDVYVYVFSFISDMNALFIACVL